VADQHAMGMQRALGRAGRAGRVDHQRRIVGGRVDRREIGRRARDGAMEVERALPGAVERQDQLQLGQLVAKRDDLAEPLRIGDQRPRACVLQAIRDRVRPEQHGERQRDRAELVDRDMNRRDLRSLRQQDGDAVAARDAVGGERVGEAIGRVAQPAEADLVVPAVGMDVENGEARRIRRGPAVADLDAHVVTLGHVPAELRIERIIIPHGWESRREIGHAQRLIAAICTVQQVFCHDIAGSRPFRRRFSPYRQKP
jgi:hypothetical protein